MKNIPRRVADWLQRNALLLNKRILRLSIVVFVLLGSLGCAYCVYRSLHYPVGWRFITPIRAPVLMNPK